MRQRIVCARIFYCQSSAWAALAMIALNALESSARNTSSTTRHSSTISLAAMVSEATLTN